MTKDLIYLRSPDTEDDTVDIPERPRRECKEKPKNESDQLPAKKDDSGITVFPSDIDAETRWDESKICPRFMCKMNYAEICGNSYAGAYEHPCIRRACAFYGNCYACEKETCDYKGQYMLLDKTSRFL